MAVTPIPVYVAPFQGSEAITGRSFGSVVSVVGTSPQTGLAMAATTEMSFVNDGYTVLFVMTTAAVTPNMTLTAVPDNAGRSVNIGPTALTNAGAGSVLTRAFGPFRPIWWNFGGVVNVTFSNATSVLVTALTFKF